MLEGKVAFVTGAGSGIGRADAVTLEALASLQPLTGAMGTPEDVAGAPLYLASDLSRFVTGTVLPVDGGWTAQGWWRRGRIGLPSWRHAGSPPHQDVRAESRSR